MLKPDERWHGFGMLAEGFNLSLIHIKMCIRDRS